MNAYLFDIFHPLFIGPDFIEPRLEIGPVPVAVHHQIEFDIGSGRQAQAALREIGTAENGVVAPAVVDVVELAVQKIRLADRPDFGLGAQLVRTVPGHGFLLQPMGQRQAFTSMLNALGSVLSGSSAVMKLGSPNRKRSP